MSAYIPKPSNFPTKFAKEQTSYAVKDKSKMYLFDCTTQFVYKMSFNLGDIHGNGVDHYVWESYNAVDKTFYFAPHDIRFSRRWFHDPTDPTTTNPADQRIKNQIDLDTQDYTFLNDQLVFDPQLNDNAFRLKGIQVKMVLDSVNTTFLNPDGLSGWPANDLNSYDLNTDYYKPNTPNQLESSRKIMKDKTWIKRFAQKHFLLIFKSNQVNDRVRVLYGFPIKDLRFHPADQTKY